MSFFSLHLYPSFYIFFAFVYSFFFDGLYFFVLLFSSYLPFQSHFLCFPISLPFLSISLSCCLISLMSPQLFVPPSLNRTCRCPELRTTAERWISSSISPAPTPMPSPCPSCRPISSSPTTSAASSPSRGWPRVASRPDAWRCRG